MTAPRVLTVSSSQPEPALVEQAAQALRAGGLVAFPTETVYGLAADARNPQAIERLNRVKGRPPEKPYSIHLGDLQQVRAFVREVPPLAERLMQRFWPGPLTIVLSARSGSTLRLRSGSILSGVEGSKGDGTVGFRLPSHPVAAAFLRACACPVVAPSANRSGFPPPTDGGEVLAALGEQFDCLLDAGPTPLGRESTVVSVVENRLEILREGAISAETIQAAVRG